MKPEQARASIPEELARSIIRRMPEHVVDMLVGECEVCAESARGVLAAAGITPLDVVLMCFGGSLDA